MRLWALAVLLWPGLAAADVAEDASRIVAGWSDAGGKVAVEQHAAFLFPQSAQSIELRQPGCGRLVLLGPMGLSFDAQIRGAEPEYRSSFAGLVDVGPWCVGEHGTTVRIGAPAGRGTVEVLFGRGATAALDVFGVLGRPRPREPNLGVPPAPPPPLPGGHERFAAKARRAGAIRVERKAVAGDDPTFRLALEPGCYTSEVAAVGAREGARYDLDAEVRAVGDAGEDDTDAERVLAVDRSSAPEAALEFCLVEPIDVEVRVRGVTGARETRLSIAAYPLRLAVPAAFGASARNAVERAWRVRGGTLAAPRLREAEFFASGLVRRRVSARAGTCHVAFAAALDGAPRNLVLSIGERRDEIRQSAIAASVAFCTESDESVDIDVDSRGAVPGVAFLLYEVGS